MEELSMEERWISQVDRLSRLRWLSGPQSQWLSYIKADLDNGKMPSKKSQAFMLNINKGNKRRGLKKVNVDFD